MTPSPRVSIVLPLFNDEEHVASALDSALAQTVKDVEIICIDDASSDSTGAIVEAYRQRDARVRTIRLNSNSSAFQARRAGVMAASAPYVLFLDGDDELDARAAEITLEIAKDAHADVVGFGVEVVAGDQDHPARFERAIQPTHEDLVAPGIVQALFPVGEEANGHIWRYLFKTHLLTDAYAGIPADLKFYRANDLPITFLALARSMRYRSTSRRLYRYHFRRGTSGHTIDSVEQFEFLLSGIDPITAIADQVVRVADMSAAREGILESYRSARLHMIGNVLRSCVATTGALQAKCLQLLDEKVGRQDVLRACAMFAPAALSAISAHTAEPAPPAGRPRSVLISTAHLRTGGLQGVVLAHAWRLAEMGYTVTLAVIRADKGVDVPPGVELVEITGATTAARIDRWLQICQERSVDVIIDHHLLYNDSWPLFVLASLAAGIPTIGWIHNFALRPLFDADTHGEFLRAHLRLLLNVVVLSPTDVSFWKLRGLERIVYLPNPPSRLALAALAKGIEPSHPTGRLELAWWGRLDPATKQVPDLIAVAAHLRKMDVSFRLRIIGPDSPGLTAQDLRRAALKSGVQDIVEILDGCSQDELLSTLSDAHMLVMTSSIEGSPLTIIEAQALGLPVTMYDLPWVDTLRGNRGVLTTPPGDPRALAEGIRDIASDENLYTSMSRAGREYASAVAAVDTGRLVADLINGDLSVDHSPEPTLADARLIIEWMSRFSDRNLRSNRRMRAILNERDRAQLELKRVMDGPSFKIGRILTFLPRAVRRAVGGRSTAR